MVMVGAVTGKGAYLVVLSQGVVALDIAMTIEEFDPAAPVVAALSCDEAVPVLDSIDRIAVAFVDKAPEAYADSVFARKVAERGGRVVLLGQEAEEKGADLGFAVLERPFSTEHVTSHLAAQMV
jgi:hypothetical protein